MFEKLWRWIKLGLGVVILLFAVLTVIASYDDIFGWVIAAGLGALGWYLIQYKSKEVEEKIKDKPSVILKTEDTNKKLSNCKTCDGAVSKKAKICPYCGEKKPVKRPNNVVATIIIFVCFVWIIQNLSDDGTSNYSPSYANPNTVNVQKEAWQWQIQIDRSPMDDSKTVQVFTEAKNTTQAWLKNVRPTLVIRCKENATDMIMDAGTSFHVEYGKSSQSTVRMRIDDGAPVQYVWSQSTDGEALFAKRPIGLARKLYHAKRLRIEFTPFNASPVTAEFSLQGLQKHLPTVAQTCNWTI